MRKELKLTIVDYFFALLIVFLLAISFTSNAQVEKIRVLDLKRNNIKVEINPTLGIAIPSGYIEVMAMFRVAIPSAIANTPNMTAIAETYKDMYSINRIDTIGGQVYAVFLADPISLNIYKVNASGNTTNDLITDVDIKQALLAEYAIYEFKFGQFQLFPFDGIIGKSLLGTAWLNSPQN